MSRKVKKVFKAAKSIVSPAKPKPAPAPAPVAAEPVTKKPTAVTDEELKMASKRRGLRGRASGYASLMTSGRRDETLGA